MKTRIEKLKRENTKIANVPIPKKPIFIQKNAKPRKEFSVDKIKNIGHRKWKD